MSEKKLTDEEDISCLNNVKTFVFFLFPEIVVIYYISDCKDFRLFLFTKN